MSASSQDQIYNNKFYWDALGCECMTYKRNVVLYLDKDLVEKSKEMGFNLSKTFENHLKYLITGNSPVSTQNISNLTIQNSKWWAGPDSDRRPSARQADVLTRLDDRPTLL